MLFVWLDRLWPGVLRSLVILRPETVMRRHRAGFRAYWRWKSQGQSGRPKTANDVRELIREISLATPLWGAPRFLVRDRDRSYGEPSKRRIRSMGIRDRPTASRSPWQNPYVERPIGSLRRDCLDHLIVFNEAHLRRALASDVRYDNQTRAHLALEKDAPFGRAIQRVGRITRVPQVGGLYCTSERIQ